MSKTLYHERRQARTPQGPMNNPVTDYVEVWVRLWNEQNMGSEVVLHWMVMVDGDIVVEARKALPYEHPNAHYIRKGIATFDELLAAHPNRDELKPAF